jgi:beta-xylosidase
VEIYLFPDATRHMNTPSTARSSLTQPNRVRMTTARTEMISSTMNPTTRLNAIVKSERLHCELPVRLDRTSPLPAAAHSTQVTLVRTEQTHANTAAAQVSPQPKRFGQRAAVDTYLFNDTTLHLMNATHNTCSKRTSSEPKPVRVIFSHAAFISSTMNATTRLNATVKMESNRCELPCLLHLSMWATPVALFDQMPCVRLSEAGTTVAARRSQSPKRVRTAK